MQNLLQRFLNPKEILKLTMAVSMSAMVLSGCSSNSKIQNEMVLTNETTLADKETASPERRVSPTYIRKDYTSAMWFSFLDFQEMPGNNSEETFTAEVEKILSNLDDLGINTLYVHAVAYTDAFYESSIYPKTRLIGDFNFDPLEIFTEKAHQHNIHVEAWMNPLRSVSVEESYVLDGTILGDWISENNERIRQVNGRYYLNPAYPEVRELICSVAREILGNYNVDGIHFDDYFYPEGTDERFDAYIYGETVQKEEISLDDFRRRNVNLMVKEVHDTVKRVSSKLTFGISVAGNMENDIYILYADPSAWIEEGTIDYLIPQVYWGYDHPTKPYEQTFAEWISLTEGTKVEMYTGLAAYKIGYEDYYAGNVADEWVENTDMLSRQIMTANEYGGKGFAVFRYGSLYYPAGEVLGNVEKEIINIKNLLSMLPDLSK